jgi:RNA polymerase sigma-70 factor (ECF subfamily)
VRYCARRTGDPDAAEDLAQQALLEAWRKADRLCGPAVREAWLLGIARNVCLRWARARGVAARRLVRLEEPDGAPADEPADDCDLEVELERDELARLLDRALALLPPATRAVLIGRFIEESPQAEVAARLGLTEGAVEARLQRGKLALRRVLTGELREDARAHGLLPSDDGGWQETRIWCGTCGVRKLVGRFGEGRDLWLDCPDCPGRGRTAQMRAWVAERAHGIRLAEALAGVKGFKPASNRLLAHNYAVFKDGIAGRTARCLRCGDEAPLRVDTRAFAGYRDVRTSCPRCGWASGIATTAAVALNRPEAWAFQRAHGRVRTLPGRAVEAAGVPALVATMETLTGAARLEVVLTRDTLEVIGVHGAPEERAGGRVAAACRGGGAAGRASLP